MNRLKIILHNFRSDQRGAAFILVAAGMAVLLGFAALVTDIGMLVLHKQRLSNAVDAAALAGAAELPANPFLARDIAENYALLNGCTSDPPQISAHKSCPDAKITVTATKQVEFTFARALGINTGTVSAQASAAVAAISSFQGAAPLSIPNQDFTFNTRYILKQGSNSPDPSPLGPGTYGALSLGGSGASKYESNLKYGYDGKLTVGDEIDTETGNMSNPTKRAIDWRISQCEHSPACSPACYEPGCPKILIIPVYEPVNIEDGQVKRIKIAGFAAFLVERVTGQGNENYIEGYFIRLAVDGDSVSGAIDCGVKGVKLVQ